MHKLERVDQVNFKEKILLFGVLVRV